MLNLVAVSGILSNHSLCNFTGLNHGVIESVFFKFPENKQSLRVDPEYFSKIPRRDIEPPPPKKKVSILVVTMSSSEPPTINPDGAMTTLRAYIQYSAPVANHVNIP